MKTRKLDSFPPNSNPFNHDLYHMGKTIGTNVTIMMENHDNKECKYLIIVDRTTGQRLRVDFLEGEENEAMMHSTHVLYNGTKEYFFISHPKGVTFKIKEGFITHKVVEKSFFRARKLYKEYRARGFSKKKPK